MGLQRSPSFTCSEYSFFDYLYANELEKCITDAFASRCV